MPVCRRCWNCVAVSLVLLLLSFSATAFGQGSYTAQVRGTVTDPAHAVVNSAKVTVTNESTSITTTATTNASGEYVVNGLRPASYTIKVEAPGFRDTVRTGLVLAVNQQATVDFSLSLASTKETVTVTETAPLLDTGSSSLGTEVTNEFVSRMPLQGRDATQLVYLSAGVTKLNNADAYPTGTDFSSNGQRYGSAEIRLDGNLATGPEQGEGATNNLSYMPSTEVIQEFKVQNNSFAAEFGSNGGTVVNVLMKSGTNKFHGSGWWFGQRAGLNANDFFSVRNGIPRSQGTVDQYGFSLSGPIFKGKTFFLVDLEKVRNISKSLVSGRVPTALERAGNFTQTLTQDSNGNTVPVQLFNPFNVDTNPKSLTYGDRQPFPVDPTTNSTEVIPQSMMSPVWNELNAKNAFPLPTGPIDNSGNNFNAPIIETTPTTQFDIKLDHQLTNNVHLMGRYSQNSFHDTTPGLFFDGSQTQVTTRNVALEHTWTLTSHLLLTSRFGLEFYYQNETPQTVDPTQFGFQSILTEANHITKMTEVAVDNYAGLNPQCCINTINGHTQYVYSSSLNWVKGNHVLKFGGEQRLFFNNFFQPDDGTGLFHFGGNITAANAFFDPNSQDGDAMSALELGWPSDGHLNIKPAVLEKSKQTDFYAQDDWKVTPRLTLSLGMRYEWSVPYTERYNRIQFSNFAGNSGVTVNLTPPPPSSGLIVDNNGNPVDLSSLGLGSTQLLGTTQFPSSSMRHVPIDRNNFGPRLGFAYQVLKNTVVRGGMGLFYGLSTATNFQYPGTAFSRSANFHISLDGVTLAPGWALNNVFPTLPANTFPQPQGTKYGALAEWGLGNGNDLGATSDRNPEIYQWNLGLQHLFPGSIVISADYSANRSTHLPWGGATRNRDSLPTAARNLCDSTCQSSLVPNPFQGMFTGPNAVFNEPDSIYNNPTIPIGNLLRRFPQFDGDFEGLPLTEASSWFNGLLVRFQKRPSHGLSLEGNYTWSKATDYSSYGANSFIFFQGSGLGNPQDINNLRAEHSIGANDTPQRFVLAAEYDLPFGRKRWMGGDMNRALDAVVGGWSLNTILTLQSGQPVPFALANSSISDGQQRPDITCSNLRTGLNLHNIAFSSDPNASYYNGNCFSIPNDQVPGNAPRFSANARGEGIKNTDMGFFKDFTVHEGMKLELRAEFFNLTNTVRFRTPDSFLGDTNFGKVTRQANHPRNGQIAVRFEF
jgi:hypothetical protein